MKTTLLTLALGILTTAQIALAHPDGPGVTKSKAAELTAHRIDRLVSLKKIDSSFLTKTAKMEVTVLQNQAPAFYKVHVTQTQPAQGQAMQMDVIYDDDGKPLSFSVAADGTPGPDDGWTGVDAVSLFENGLHYVIENGEKDAKVKPFYTGLSTITLSKGQLDGKIVALTQIKSSESPLTLNVYLNLDGSFVSSEFVQ